MSRRVNQRELHTLKRLDLCSLPVRLKLGLLQPLIRAGSLPAQACSLLLLLCQLVLSIRSALPCQTEVLRQLLQLQVSAGRLRNIASLVQGVASKCSRHTPYGKPCRKHERSCA